MYVFHIIRYIVTVFPETNQNENHIARKNTWKLVHSDELIDNLLQNVLKFKQYSFGNPFV